MKKITKLLLATGLTFSVAGAAVLGAVSIKKQALRVNADTNATVTLKGLGADDLILTNQKGKYLYEVYDDAGFDTSNENEYLIGFATQPLSEYGDPFDFYFEADELQYTNVNGDMTLYAGWASKNAINPVFTPLSDGYLDKNSEVQSLGEFSFSNLPVRSIFYNETPLTQFIMELNVTDLVNVEDPTDIIPLEYYNEVLHVKAISYNSEKHYLYDKDDEYEGYSTIVGTRDFIYIDGYGTDEDAENFADLIENKVVIVNRGSIDFTSKGNNLAAKNPAAILCLNNQDGYVKMALDYYTYDIPYYSVNLSLKNELKANATKGTKSGTDYYTGSFEFLSNTFEQRIPFNFVDDLYIECSPEYAQYEIICGYDSSLLKAGALYKAEISYEYGGYDNSYNEIIEWHEHDAKTTIYAGDKVLKSVSLSGTYKTEFNVGDKFSYNGIEVTAHYNGDITEDVNGVSVDYSQVNMMAPGTYTVTVSYTENNVTKSVTYQVTVKEEKAPVNPDQPSTPDTSVTPEQGQKPKGLSGGAIAGIVIASVVVVGVGGFAVFWFVLKKKTFADLIAVFKKK